MVTDVKAHEGRPEKNLIGIGSWNKSFAEKGL